MNCQHYHICISENGSLCEDSNKYINNGEKLMVDKVRTCDNPYSNFVYAENS
jgi:hypothetical protein